MQKGSWKQKHLCADSVKNVIWRKNQWKVKVLLAILVSEWKETIIKSKIKSKIYKLIVRIDTNIEWKATNANNCIE